MSQHEQVRRRRKARAAMDLFEQALDADGDPATLIAGAAQPRATRRLALGMLAVDSAAGEALEPLPPPRSNPGKS